MAERTAPLDTSTTEEIENPDRHHGEFGRSEWV